MIYQVSGEEEVHESLAYYKRLTENQTFSYDNHDVICPFCTARYVSIEEERPAVKCVFCKGKGKQAQYLDDKILWILSLISELSPETQSKYYKQILTLVKGAYRLEAGRRLRKIMDDYVQSIG